MKKKNSFKFKDNIRSFFDNSVLIITYAYVILSPLYFNYNNIHMEYTPAVETLKKVWFLATLYIFIGNLICMIRDKRKPNLLETLIIIFPFLYLLPICFGTLTLTIGKNIRYIIISMLISSHILALSRIMNKKTLDSILKFYIISTALSCIISLVVYSNPTFASITQIQVHFGDYYKSSVDRLYGTMLYPNAYAIFILIGYFLNYYYIKEKKIYNYFFNFYYLLFFTLTLSKITFIIFVILNLLIFGYYIISKKTADLKEYISVHISMIFSLLFMINQTRIFTFNCNLYIYISLMIIFFLIHYVIYWILNYFSKKNIIYIGGILLIVIVLVTSFYNSKSINLEVNNITKDNNFIFVDFQDLEKSTKYKMTVKINNETIDNYAHLELRYLYPKAHFILKRKVDIQKLNVGMKEYVFEFETKDYFEFYYLRLTNITKDNNLEIYPVEVENLKTGEIKLYQVNTSYIPYIFVKSFEQLKYDKASLVTRLQMYDKAVTTTTQEKYIFGRGIKAFATSTGFNDEHSFVARMLSEVGYIGVIHYFLLLILGIYYSLKILKQKKNIVFIILFMLIAGGSIFDLNLNYEFLRFSLYLFLVLLNFKTVNLKKEKINNA